MALTEDALHMFVPENCPSNLSAYNVCNSSVSFTDGLLEFFKGWWVMFKIINLRYSLLENVTGA